MEDRKSRGTALVTGASSGIGKELARLIALDGYDLILVARRAERLETLARELSVSNGISARVVARDLSRPGSASELAAELERERLDVRVLVNSAGLGASGRFWK